MSLKGKNVLFFAGPLYEDLELCYPKIRLEEEGAATVVAGLGERTYQGKRGYPVTVDTNVDQVEAADFNGLVIPGGFAPDQLRRYEKVLAHARRPAALLPRPDRGPTPGTAGLGRSAPSARSRWTWAASRLPHPPPRTPAPPWGG